VKLTFELADYRLLTLTFRLAVPTTVCDTEIVDMSSLGNALNIK